MKKNQLILSILAVIILFSCEREFENPYDRNCPSEIWTPENLTANNSDGDVLLTWNQTNEHFDGFMIERSSDGSDWDNLFSNNLDNQKKKYTDTTAIAGDTVFYRICAIADKNTSNYCYSDPIFIPIETPTVITNSTTSITYSSATFNGKVTFDGGTTVTERGFCYSQSTNPTIDNTKITSDSGTGVFIETVTELEEETTYHVKAYAINDKGIAYGEQVSFTTETNLPNVTTNTPTQITNTTATLNGYIDYTGKETITERGFCYSITSNPDIYSTKVTADTGTGTFTKDITGLTSGTTYYVRAYAICSKGITYGSEQTIKTVYIGIHSYEQTGSAKGAFYHDGEKYDYEYYFSEIVYMSGDTSYISECGIYSHIGEKYKYNTVSWIAPGYSTIAWTIWSTPDPSSTFTHTPYVKFENGDYYMGIPISPTVVYNSSESQSTKVKKASNNSAAAMQINRR